MNKLPFAITLLLGDPSGDGHGKSETIVINSNLNATDIGLAYKKGSKELGFDLVSDVCSDYEDNFIPKDIFDILVKNGMEYDLSDYEIKQLEDADADSRGINIYTDEYLNIYFFIVFCGNKDFEYELTKYPVIDIGGYGLYGS